LENIQETNSGAHAGAEMILQKYIGELNEDCTEREMDYFARIMQCDLALELRPPRLEAFSVKVRDAV